MKQRLDVELDFITNLSPLELASRVAPLIRVAIVIVFGTVGGIQFLGGLDAEGQKIPRDEYLRYLPLKYPTIVRQTKASDKMDMFGDTTDPEYQDTDPVDGIDDHRHKVLLDLAVRFAPYLVLNSTMIPMDFRLFMEREEAFLLFVDTWNVSRNPPEIVNSETINWQALSRPTSEAGSRVSGADFSDCRLLSLLETFDPFAPGPAYRSGAVAPERTEHQVMFFDFPGEGEETWKQEYVNQKSKALPWAYEDFAKVFVHPFVESVESSVTGHGGYAFVLQYWFFYPYNDGFNNHEGDWEHINVSITLLSKFREPLSKFREPLSEADVRRILAGTALDTLVIQRVDYYFHHKVMTLDYTRPNVYQPRERWETEFENTREEHFEEKWIWEQVRYRAYWDDDEMKINTHPIGFIGGDNKGADQLLEPPGGSNRVSNGTYPFSGLYKNVGPAGATEQISKRFDHRKHFAAGDHKRGLPKGGYRRGEVVDFTSPDRIEILPDGERIVNLLKADARARRDWAWLVLPIRWGYPATESPLAGMVDHTDLGNISVLGTSYNAGWNRSRDAPGFQVYSPHTFDPLLRLVLQDNFFNTLGYLNLPLALLMALPPLDISWRIIGLPFRSSLDMPDRVFQTDGPIPYRFTAMPYLGTRYRVVDPVFTNLILNSGQIDAISNRQRGAVNQDGHFIKNTKFFKNAYVFRGEIILYLNDRFATQNSFEFGFLSVDDDITFQDFAKVSQLRSIEFYEYSGSIRWNLKTGSLMVFLKGGYGWNLYRLWKVSINNDLLVYLEKYLVEKREVQDWDVSIDDNLFVYPDGPWVNKPNWERLSTFLPNTWHFGGGVEWLLLRDIASRPDLGIRGEVLIYRDSLRINIDTVGPNSSGVPFTRYAFNLGITIRF